MYVWVNYYEGGWWQCDRCEFFIDFFGEGVLVEYEEGYVGVEFEVDFYQLCVWQVEVLEMIECKQCGGGIR